MDLSLKPYVLYAGEDIGAPREGFSRDRLRDRRTLSPVRQAGSGPDACHLREVHGPLRIRQTPLSGGSRWLMG